ncbi:L-type lectin-domain containing receptor kinase SIT2-like [Phragmites australis]|uniref:L-type lectin-domain containing receptor kinase SIT2-like n=1 Tax=Phragmites australis TaxID=29695 RepID=UPI002D797D08|nr:L-type lectin-domain containing receptor kinase SIT2-like [Phragmites australis]
MYKWHASAISGRGLLIWANRSRYTGSGRTVASAAYQGVLPRSGANVAVKKISHDSRHGLREFMSEIASMNRLHHRNLVQLLGYCWWQGELVLVYDYMVNGGVEKHLFTAGQPVVVHRDIKVSNVLLDDEMNDKLSDFSLALLYDHDSNPQTTHIIRTIGYLALEMRKTGKATTSIDVFVEK